MSGLGDLLDLCKSAATANLAYEHAGLGICTGFWWGIWDSPASNSAKHICEGLWISSIPI